MTQTADIDTTGFPPGYFIIRSVASNRLLDVTMDYIEDGTEICLWPEKEKSLVESVRDPGTNNQVFFIDTSGALCSRSAGHAIDIEDEESLVIRHRRPVSQPFPNDYAHPLPRFVYSSKTGEISVQFACDPSFPPGASSQAWRSKTYLLVSIPKRKPRTILDDASDFFTSKLLTSPMSLFTGSSASSPHVKPDEISNRDTGIDLTEDEILEEDKGEEAEVDNSTDLGRKVRIIEVPTAEKNMMDLLLSEKAKKRRKWVVIPLRSSTAKTV